MKLKTYLLRVWHCGKLVCIKLTHQRGEHFFHLTYLGMVGWEAHGNYRYAAIALFVAVIANLISGVEP